MFVVSQRKFEKFHRAKHWTWSELSPKWIRVLCSLFVTEIFVDFELSRQFIIYLMMKTNEWNWMKWNENTINFITSLLKIDRLIWTCVDCILRTFGIIHMLLSFKLLFFRCCCYFTSESHDKNTVNGKGLVDMFFFAFTRFKCSYHSNHICSEFVHFNSITIKLNALYNVHSNGLMAS